MQPTIAFILLALITATAFGIAIHAAWRIKRILDHMHHTINNIGKENHHEETR